MVKHLPTMRETQVRSLGREDPLEKAMAPHSSTLAWKIPWTEEHGRLQSMGCKELDTTEQLHFHFLRYQRLELQHSLFLEGEHISITLSKKSKEASKPGFSNTWIENFQMFKLVLEKAEKPEIKLPTSDGSSKKQESSKKTSISDLLTMPKPLTVWITINCGKFWKRWEYQTTWPASWEPVCRSGSNS